MPRLRKFQMTYPYTGNIIESSSLKKAVKQCYHEFKQTNGIPEGLFTVTDLDQQVEYKFKKRRKKKIEQIGGEGEIPSKTDPKTEADAIYPSQAPASPDHPSALSTLDEKQIVHFVEEKLNPINAKLLQYEERINQLVAKLDKVIGQQHQMATHRPDYSKTKEIFPVGKGRDAIRRRNRARQRSQRDSSEDTEMLLGRNQNIGWFW